MLHAIRSLVTVQPLLLAAILYACCTLLILNTMSHVDPYMDELYHIPQAQRYCMGKWGRDNWDGKITTFPGIYLTAYAFKRGLTASFVIDDDDEDGNYDTVTNAVCGYKLDSDTCEQSCNPRYLRAISAVLGCATLALIYIGRRRRINHNNAAEIAFLVCLCPCCLLYSFLFYTDAASLAFLIAAYVASMEMREIHNKLRHDNINTTLATVTLYIRQFAVLGINCFTILMRQTNVIWILFFGATLAAQELASMNPDITEGQMQITLNVVITVLKEVSNLTNFGRLCKVCWPYILPVACTLLFFVYNGGITLGDSENHRFFPHLAMPLHLIFIFSLLDGWVLRSIIKFMLYRVTPEESTTVHSRLQVGVRAGRNWHEWALRLLLHVAGLGAVCAALTYFSIGHIFILSDNRHYTYYLWKRFMSHRHMRACLGFVYYPCLYVFFKRLLVRKGTIWTLGFAVALCLTLVPTPLLELRYFTPGIALALLVMGGSEDEGGSRVSKFVDRAVLWYNVFLCVLVNSLVLFVYFYRFWQDGAREQGDLSRFMW